MNVTDERRVGGVRPVVEGPGPDDARVIAAEGNVGGRRTSGHRQRGYTGVLQKRKSLRAALTGTGPWRSERAIVQEFSIRASLPKQMDNPRAVAAVTDAPAVSLLPVFLIVLVDVFGMTLVIPLLTIYAETFHATPLQATLLISVFASASSSPVRSSGMRRTGAAASRCSSSARSARASDFVVLARATSLWMIYLSRVIDGATAGNLSLAQAYISDNTSPTEPSARVRADRHCLRPRLLRRPAAHRLPVSQLRTDDAHLPGGGDVGDEHSLHRDAAEGRPASRFGSPVSGRNPLDWKTYAQYFARPGLRPRLWQFLFFMLAFSTFISGFALFAERRFHWQGHPFGPREIGYRLRVRRPARHHPAGRAHRTTRRRGSASRRSCAPASSRSSSATSAWVSRIRSRCSCSSAQWRPSATA